MNNIDAGNALNGSALAALKRDAAGAGQSDATLRKVAQQFEALMTQQILKSSRANALGEDLMGGAGLDLYKDMFDQQMAQQISAKGLGLADVLVQQLRGPKPPAEAGAVTPMAFTPTAPKPERVEAAAPTAPLSERVAKFVQGIWRQAEVAAKALGLPTEAVVGHAALETGWGAHQPGGGSNNLFGIKADSRWQGSKVSAATTEMDGGHSRRENAQFRAYGSTSEGLADYVRFLKTNPRYAEAIKAGVSSEEFAHGLQKAGYATDPNYAEKLKTTIARVAAAKPAARPAI